MTQRIPVLPLRTIAACLASLLAVTGCGGSAAPAAAGGEVGSTGAHDAEIRTALGGFIEREMADKQIPTLSIALVDGERVVWTAGFGTADPASGQPADADTLYRVGSVSKLFTDIAIMQQVEQGKLDIDAPVTTILPEFKPQGEGAGAITLHQLMSHRSGVVREPPVGSYFDASGPTLEATVASLNQTQLAYAPGTRAKYSNAGVSVAGLALERIAAMPMPAYMQQHVLGPLGMGASAFAPPPSPKQAQGVMWTVDGRTSPAPRFLLGTGPAGELQSSANDMSKFIRMLLAQGRGDNGALLKPETLKAMWTPWQGEDCATSCYGIGFSMGTLDGHRRVGHGGAIYGFSTQLSVLPEQQVGVVVMASKDVVNAVVERIADTALRALLAAKTGDAAAIAAVVPAETGPLSKEQALKAAGVYVADDGHAIELSESASVLTLQDLAGGSPQRLRLSGKDVVIDGPLGIGGTVTLADDAITLDGRRYARRPASKPADAPAALRGLIGEYGEDHNVLYVFEREGQLWTLVEWIEFDPLTAVAGTPDAFAFPDSSMYVGEQLRFERDAAGKVTRAVMGGIVLPRRVVGPEEGAAQQFITPLRPVAELLPEAMKATPPVEKGDFLPSDLVEVGSLDPTIKLDVRYASENNFLRSKFYAQQQVFQQRPAAEALVRAHRKLAAQGYGLLLHDGYRPWFVTKVFYDATPDAQKEFVANPAEGSRHNRGAAIDLNLYHLSTGKPVEMVATYDETTARSYPDYPGGTSLQRWHRRLLREALESEGFTVIANEWWHFDYNDWQRYGLGNASFEALSKTP